MLVIFLPMSGNRKTDAGEPVPMLQSWRSSGALEILSIVLNNAVYHRIQIINS